MGPRRMIEVPIPSRFNVSIMISDGGAIVLKEVDRLQLENGLIKIVPILEELDRDLNKVYRPQQTLSNAINAVVDYRAQNHCSNHLEYRATCEACRLARRQLLQPRPEEKTDGRLLSTDDPSRTAP